MSKIPVQEAPELNLEMEAFETTTPAYAPIFNDRYEQLLNNDKSVDEKVKSINASVEEKINDISKSVDSKLTAVNESVDTKIKSVKPAAATKESAGTVILSDDIDTDASGKLQQNFIKKIGSITIATSDWVASGSSYIYTISNDSILADSVIEIFYAQGTDIEPTYSQATGSVAITVDSIPTNSVVIDSILIINAKEVA